MFALRKGIGAIRSRVVGAARAPTAQAASAVLQSRARTYGGLKDEDREYILALHS